MNEVKIASRVGRRVLVTSVGLGLAATLAGCATELKAVETATGVVDSTGAISLWGIVKGVAGVALIADPGLATIVNAAIATGETLLADVKAGTATAAASATSLTAQANTLLLATAGVITVVANTATAAG